MLSDEEIHGIFYPMGTASEAQLQVARACTRAIESAACAERDARIAELEKECDRLETYWNKCLADCKNIAELELALEEARSKAAELERDAIRFRFANDSQEEFAICYWHEDEDGGDWWCDGPRGCAIELLDAAIDAAIKEQT